MPTHLKTYMNVKIPENHQLSKITQEKIGYLNNPIVIMETAFVIKNFPVKRNPGSEGCTGKSYQYLRRK